MFEKIADNCSTVISEEIRDDSLTGDDNENPLLLYLKWHILYGHYASPSKKCKYAFKVWIKLNNPSSVGSHPKVGKVRHFRSRPKNLFKDAELFCVVSVTSDIFTVCKIVHVWRSPMMLFHSEFTV